MHSKYLDLKTLAKACLFKLLLKTPKGSNSYCSSGVLAVLSIVIGTSEYKFSKYVPNSTSSKTIQKVIVMVLRKSLSVNKVKQRD